MTCYLMENGTVELPANFIYTNDWYVVVPNEEGIGYKIINSRTGVTEGFSDVLASAVSKATAWCELMIELANKEASSD